jgi:uncharacterized protein YecE (DUF72 family)
MRIGIAGWSLSKEAAASFPGEGHHLQRYSQVLGCAEINSSFHRSHRVEVYERWASETPPGFRFSAKLPRTITHEGRLRRAREPLKRFLAEAAGLGDKLAVLLVQLPPSFAFDAPVVRRFFGLLAELWAGGVVCEPRHASWFTPAADRVLAACRVGRVAADPARSHEAMQPGGWLGAHGDGRGALLYHRWHGSPRMYWSHYEAAWLQARAQELVRWPAQADCWCIFDNTAGGGGVVNALALQGLIGAAAATAGRQSAPAGGSATASQSAPPPAA